MEKSWFNKTSQEVEQELKTDYQKGLSSSQVQENMKKYGLNELQEKKKDSLLKKFLEQFKDFSIIVLIIAAIVSGVVGVAQGEGFTDTIIILIVVILNAVIGVAQESKAEKSLEALKKLSSHASKVIRNGKEQVIPARELVPGDLVIIETGDYIAADLRIIEAVNLKSQEASLTGESVPVEKITEKIDGNEIGIGDRKNMLFSSSLITYGRGKAIVVNTGMNTEVGKIAGMLDNAEKQETPLQQKLNDLGKTLGIACLAICAVIFVIGLLQGKEIIDMFMTAVSLAVAVIPEGLVAVSTIVLAIGVQKMVKKHAIVKKLPAVETLGSSTVICSDKTGTLTQNKMTVEKVFCDDELQDVKKVNTTEDFKKLVYNCMLCNDSRLLEDGQLAGDPTETALVDMAFKLDYEQSIYRENPRVEEVPFDSERKLMTTVNKKNGKYIVYTKGGVDELLKCCNSFLYKGEVRTSINNYAKWIRENNEKMAKDALRVLAFAYKELDHMPSKTEMKTIESDLTFIGMVGMIDPPRIEAKKAVEKCKKAGIKTVMITGDHKITAVAIAKKLGILKDESEALTGTELEKMTDEEFSKKSLRICNRLLNNSQYLKSKVIYCYYSVNKEVDLLPFIKQALEDGKIIAFPKVKGQNMDFFEVKSLEELEPGYFNIPEPPETTPAPKGDLIIVPGVAFSKKGERLGYGGGFYDRFLEHHKVYTIGVAYDFQIMNSLPTEEHDMKLNEIISN